MNSLPPINISGMNDQRRIELPGGVTMVMKPVTVWTSLSFLYHDLRIDMLRRRHNRMTYTTPEDAQIGAKHVCLLITSTVETIEKPGVHLSPAEWLPGIHRNRLMDFYRTVMSHYSGLKGFIYGDS